VREGDPGRDMYVIQSGRVRVTRKLGGEERELAILGKGQFFGEMSLLESLPREADVRAIEDSELLVLGPGDLLMRIRRDPTFAIEMLHALSGRMRGLLARLDEALKAGDDA
jgi:CRP/FNR family transcriptional regulator, cyclic AMP receptor protein